jgi:hypothetical protein
MDEALLPGSSREARIMVWCGEQAREIRRNRWCFGKCCVPYTTDGPTTLAELKVLLNTAVDTICSRYTCRRTPMTPQLSKE